MRLNLVKCMLVGTLVMAPIGCEPRPVVVPDGDDTTIIEEGDVDVDRDAETTPAPGTGVDVNVGGERGGVDVDVNRDAADQPTQNP
ncbi:MAG: hypothetical protein WD738_15115 [Pirellulales bacterium]